MVNISTARRHSLPSETLDASTVKIAPGSGRPYIRVSSNGRRLFRCPKRKISCVLTTKSLEPAVSWAAVARGALSLLLLWAQVRNRGGDIWTFSTLARGFASDLLASAPKIHIQVLLLLLQAVFWHQFLDAACRWFKKWSRALAMHKQWVALNTRSFAGLGIRPNSFSEEETAACMLLAILCQHTIGGALCLPAVLGFAPPTLAHSLARHGALMEAGWELQDFARRAWMMRFDCDSSRRLNPPGATAFIAIHHAMGQLMVVPMNLYYGSNSSYHELVFLLQSGAAFAGLVQQFGYTLNLTEARDLRQMQVCSSVTWLVWLWTRGVRFTAVGGTLLATLRADGARVMWGTGGVVLGLMGVFNLLVLIEASAKLRKYLKSPLSTK